MREHILITYDSVDPGYGGIELFLIPLDIVNVSELDILNKCNGSYVLKQERHEQKTKDLLCIISRFNKECLNWNKFWSDITLDMTKDAGKWQKYKIQSNKALSGICLSKIYEIV